MVRAAIASSSVPISSITITSGMWFSTASIMTWCCNSGFATCIRRARPIAGWGTSPSPAISLEVSIITTRLPKSSARTRAISRKAVVLPTPGRPSMRIDLPLSTKSRIMLIVPKTARPTRQVSPITSPRRLRMALIRWSVRSIPARLSPPKSPIVLIQSSRSVWVMGRSLRYSALPGNRASGRRPKSITTSISWSLSGWAWSLSRRSVGSISSSLFKSSVMRLSTIAASALNAASSAVMGTIASSLSGKISSRRLASNGILSNGVEGASSKSSRDTVIGNRFKNVGTTIWKTGQKIG